MNVSPKEEAEQLISDFSFRGTPLNDALICANEILYDYKYKSHNPKMIKYWEKVIEELKKMHPGYLN